jgi:hypothetical protein
VVKCFIVRLKLLEFSKNGDECTGVSGYKEAVNYRTVRFFLEFSSVCWSSIWWRGRFEYLA